MEHAIGTGKLETGTFRQTHQRRQALGELIAETVGRSTAEMQAVRIPEEQTHATAFVAAEAQHSRTIHRNTAHTIHLAKRTIAETLAGRALINRVNVVVFTAIHGADGEHVVDGLRGIPLGFAQHRPQHRITVALIDRLVDPLRQLHNQER